MSPSNEPPGAGDIAVVSTNVFETFAKDTYANMTKFRGATSIAMTQPSPGHGDLSNSQPLSEQLARAAMLRMDYIDATTTGLVGYENTSKALYGLHVQLGSVTSSTMERIMTVQSSKEGEA
ncbi:hypothetical protein ACWCOV_10475 [Kribbella sp. NPDC002412]